MKNKFKHISFICIIVILCLLLCHCTYVEQFINDYQTITSTQSNETTTTETTISTAYESNITESTKPQTFNITISFLGDCMLASYKGETNKNSLNGYIESKDPNYFFEKVYSVISTDDFTLANLENVFTDNPLKEVYKDYSLLIGLKHLLKQQIY